METPLELCVAFAGLSIGITRIASDAGSMTIFTLLLWLSLGLGGAYFIAGRFLAFLSMESVGLVLMAGAYFFTLMRAAGRTDDLTELLVTIFRYAPVAVGLLIRLVVVRRAAKAAKIGGARL